MGKSFLDLFIERDADSKEQESVQPTTAAPNGTTVFAQKPAQPQQPTQEPTDKTPGSDDAIVDKLFQTLVDNNLPGPDYLELKHTLPTCRSMSRVKPSSIVLHTMSLKEVIRNLQRMSSWLLSTSTRL